MYAVWQKKEIGKFGCLSSTVYMLKERYKEGGVCNLSFDYKRIRHVLLTAYDLVLANLFNCSFDMNKRYSAKNG